CALADGSTGTVMFLPPHVRSSNIIALACASGRFVDLGQTVYDTQSQLEWEKKVMGPRSLHFFDVEFDATLLVNWCTSVHTCAPSFNANVSSDAWIDQVNVEVFAGHTDWRLPSRDELLAALA